jgi:hypothetical protein
MIENHETTLGQLSKQVVITKTDIHTLEHGKKNYRGTIG